MAILLVVGVAALIFAGIIALFLMVLGGRQALFKSLKYELLRVTLPRPEPQAHEKIKEEIGVFEQFIATLQNYRQPVIMEIAVPYIGEEIRFYFAASRDEIEALERTIHAFWPGASIERSDDYNIFNLQGASIMSIARLREHFALPIKTYRVMDADSLAAIANAFSKLAHEGEGAAVQCIFAKAPAGAGKNLLFILGELRKGVPLRAVLRSATPLGSIAVMSSTLLGRPPRTSGSASTAEPATPIQEAPIELISQKEAKTLISVNLRIAVSAPSRERASAILDAFERAYDQFSDPRGNSIIFRRIEGTRARQAVLDFSFRKFRPTQALILNIEEAASIMHLPTTTLETPKLARIKAKTAIAPLNLPEEGLVLGRNVFRGEERIVRLLQDDKRRHVYIVGQTGTGKTALLQEMIRQDIEAGEGLCVIDPHGDLAENILGFIPQERIRDVIYFNPTDIERPVGLNILEFDPAHPEQKTFVINEMIEIMDKLYDLRQVGGPMFEQYLRNAMLLVMGDNILKPTIMEIPKVLADAAFRRELLARCSNPSVVSFWTKEAERAGGEFALANMVPYITSKLNPFIANDIVRPIVGQINTPFKFREAMDKKKIIVVNLAKGILGETNSYLLGMIVVGKILMSALSRVDQPEKERKDFTLYIDEFQNVTTKTVASILAEARKYRLAMIMAHQFIAQLREDIRDAIFGNVGTIIAFRVGPIDAELLEKQFLPVFDKQDLVNLDNYNAYIKILIRGQVSPPFNILTFPPREPNAALAQAAKEYSRLAYGRLRQDVEKEIAARVQS
jgi:hypothetical protein